MSNIQRDDKMRRDDKLLCDFLRREIFLLRRENFLLRRDIFLSRRLVVGSPVPVSVSIRPPVTIHRK